MLSTVLSVHEGLGSSGRLRPISRLSGQLSAAELGTLVGMGACAAVLSAYMRLNLGIPGHNIIRVVFPMALGLALVPRRGAGSTMGLSGLASGSLLTLLGAGRIGPGAITSLALTGVMVDVALLGARRGWSIYVRLALAGLAANMVAFAIRAATKYSAAGHSLHAIWFSKAGFTYPACGILAGLISAAVWFRATGGGQAGPRSEDLA